jgi:Zn finger protein HypA/HybF involved in hydrogenase expression
MDKFRDKLARFMYGRYGADQLYYALFILCFILMILNSFIRSDILNIFVYAILILTIFRTFSRNTYKRQIENQRFLRVWHPVRSKCSLTYRRVREFKTSRFRTCPNCRAELRLPRRKGKHTVECPRCHKDFKVSIRL